MQPDQPAPVPVPVERLGFEMPPRFDTADEERAHRKERLAGVLRLLGRLGYEDGVGGHVSARDPEFEDCYWVNPFGRAFGAIGPDDLLLVDGEGRVRQGERRVNQLAFAVHAAVHRARPAVVAVVRTQAPYGRALAALGELLAPVTQEACAFYEDHSSHRQSRTGFRRSGAWQMWEGWTWKTPWMRGSWCRWPERRSSLTRRCGNWPMLSAFRWRSRHGSHPSTTGRSSGAVCPHRQRQPGVRPSNPASDRPQHD